jgi:Tol biopolymer transport system component/DNA-binding winged helix-turn-helix (wHTH) protein
LLKERLVFKFGCFTLDPVAKVLFRDGEPVHLTRKGVETLLVLVENSGRVLTKEEIMTAVWADRIVDEANLAQNIAVVRKALHAAKGSPAHIETFPGRGYRLEGPVVSSMEAIAPPAAEVISAGAEPPTLPVAPTSDAPLNPARRFFRAAPLIAAGVLAAIALLSAAVMVKLRNPQENAEAGFRVLPATRMLGKEYQPVLTRDGRRIAFLSAENGSTPPSVWIQDSQDGSSRQVSKGGEHHSSPAWSPDGSKVAFLRVQRSATDVVIANTGGGLERIVAQFAAPTYGLDNRMLDWSPDARWLAVSHATTPGSNIGITLIHIETGQRRTLTTPGAEVAGDVDPRFSPDGSALTFLRWIHRSQQEIFMIDLREGNARQITKLGKRISSHDWTRDGRSLVFASDRRGDFRLWRLDLSAKNSGESASPLAIYSEFPIQFSIARHADSLVYSSLQQDRNIWSLELSSGEWKRIIGSSGQDASPQYSPDGTRICFRSDRTGEEQLWVSDASGANAEQLTKASVRPSVGRWSPDGSAIVFNSPQTGEVYIATSQGSGKSWSVRNSGVQGVHPVFSLDGRSVYAGGPSAIVRFDVSGENVERIVQTKSEALALSPDGKYLYFVREPNDKAVWRVELVNASITKVLDGLLPGCTSCWALTKDGIHYLGSDKQSFDKQILFFHDFRTSKDRVVATYPEPLWPLGSGPFSLSPDSKRLLCVRVEPSNSDVMLVTPFR